VSRIYVSASHVPLAMKELHQARKLFAAIATSIITLTDFWLYSG